MVISSQDKGMHSINRIEHTYRELISSGRKITKLFLGNPNEEGFHFPASLLKASYGAYFDRQDYHPQPKGLREARVAICDFYHSAGIEIDPGNLLITSGSSESFFYLFSLLSEPGDNLLTPNPAYPLFDHVAQMARVELRQYPLVEERGWEINLEELRRLSDRRTKAIVIVSPNNPTGCVTSRDQIKEVIDWANQNGIALICDEVFSEFYFGEGEFPRPMGLGRSELCFTLNGISKMLALPGLKLSWIVVTGEKGRVDRAVDGLETMNDTYLSCHIPIQESLPTLFSEGKEFLRGYQREVATRRQLILSHLPSSVFQLTPPQGGFYLMAEVRKKLQVSEEEFVIRLMRETGLFVHPGYFYDYEKGIHLVLSHLLKPETLEGTMPLLRSFIESHSSD
jgi:aspartate/methionine/tyrosine aminotransferase